MAKMKTFAVEVEITQRVTVFVQARKPNGAVEKLATRDGVQEAKRYAEDDDAVLHLEPDNYKVINVREAW